MNMIFHPYCKACGWRKGGADSWNGSACKCGLSAPAISVTVEADRMWRDPVERLRFESESGLPPLSIDEVEAAAQAFTGDTARYHSKFLSWAMQQLQPHN